MRYLIDFLRQAVPKPGKAMPAYYRKALFVSDAILAAFFPGSLTLLLGQGSGAKPGRDLVV